MINSFQPLNTITSGLILQQLEQEINANNLSQPSVDAQGYLMNSLEQVNSVSNPDISYSGANGLLSVGTGASVESVTSLRSSFLDSQIQQASMTDGYNEILSNATSTSAGTGVMDQINGIVNASASTTLTSLLSKFTTAWTALAAAASPTSPTNANFQADQTAVVNAGVAFADAANSQYNQLQDLQLSMNGQVGQTVLQINGLLSQLGSINQQLMDGGSNQNSLLDARDYALDRLSRLTNYQVSYGSNGVANVWLNDVELVNGTNVSSLQANISNINNPELMDITVQNGGGTYAHGAADQAYDITSLITGGNLGGELYGRNVLLQNYKVQVDQIATTVLDTTNNLYESGYVADSATTNIPFFNGTGAGSITVNAVLANDAATATTPFLATEIQQTSNPAVGGANPTPLPSGTLAGFLGDMGSVLANNYVQSTLSIAKAGQTVSPTATIASQLSPPLATSHFATTPTGGSFIINGVTISYTTANSINDILNDINSSVPGVYAVFNSTSQEFYMYSTGNINISEVGADNFTSWSKVKNILASTISMNNTFVANQPEIVFGGADSALDSDLSPAAGSGPNTQAFFVTPSISGTFTLNGVQISWNNTQSLQTIKTAIQAAVPGLSVSFNAVTQQLELIDSSPMTIYDNSGNFTVFTGLNGNLSVSSMASNVSSNASTQDSTYETAYATSTASLNQLNTQQDNLAGAANTYSSALGTTPGVSIASITQQAEQSMITYNAMLEVMQIIDQMLNTLVGISSSTSSGGIFQQEQS